MITFFKANVIKRLQPAVYKAEQRNNANSKRRIGHKGFYARSGGKCVDKACGKVNRYIRQYRSDEALQNRAYEELFVQRINKLYAACAYVKVFFKCHCCLPPL